MVLGPGHRADRPAPIPVFDERSFKAAIAYQRKLGRLRVIRKPPKIPQPRRLEAEYYAELKRAVALMKALVEEHVLPRLPSIVAQGAELRADSVETRFDDFDSDLERTIGAVRVAFTSRSPVGVAARRLGTKVSAANKAAHQRTIQTVLGVRPELSEPWLTPMIDNFVRQNVRLVEDVADSFFDSAERRIGDGVRQGKRADEIAAQIRGDSGIPIERAKLIARDQISSLYSDQTRVRQQKLGVKRYRWRNSDDERVRPSHEEREDEIFEWDSPIEPQLRKKGLKVDKIDGHAGRPILCRCTGEPVLEDLIEGLPPIDGDDERAAPIRPIKPPRAPRLRIVPPPPPPDDLVTVRAPVVSQGEPIPAPAASLRYPGEATAPLPTFDRDALRQALKDFNAKPEHQVAVRQQLNTLVGEHGLTPHAIDAKKKDRDKLRVRSLKGARGEYNPRTGEISVTGRVFVDSTRFLSGQDKSAIAASGLKTLVHETLHAHSPLGAFTYSRHGMWVEEVTVELGARRIMRDKFGVDLSDPDLVRSYQDPINRMKATLGDALNIKDPDRVEDLITDAAFAMRKASSPIDGPDRYLEHFIEHLAIDRSQRDIVFSRLKTSLEFYDGT